MLQTFKSLYKYGTDNKTSGKFMLTTNSHLGLKDLNKFFVVNINEKRLVQFTTKAI